MAAATGAKLELQLLGDVDRHGCEVTSVKKIARIVEKAKLQFGDRRGRTDRVCDAVRAMLVAPDVATVAAIVEALSSAAPRGRDCSVIEVVRPIRSPQGPLQCSSRIQAAGTWHDLIRWISLMGDGCVMD